MNNARQRSRNWCFTLNNYTQEEEEKIKNLECRYLVFGHEIAPGTGTKHLQGFFSLQQPRSLQGVRPLLSERAHLEIAKGTCEQNRVYCSKGTNIIERGNIPKDPRSGLLSEDKWDEAKALAKQGRMDDIPSNLYIRYKRSFDALRTEYLQSHGRQRLEQPCGVWYWGVSGAGKSWKALADYGEPPKSYLKSMNKWWDGYQDQDAAILHDYAPKHSDFMTYFLKIWADIYPFQAETKFGHIFIRPKWIVITSQYSIADCFQDKEDFEAIKRRFLKVEHFPCVYGSVLPRAKPATATISPEEVAHH